MAWPRTLDEAGGEDGEVFDAAGARKLLAPRQGVLAKLEASFDLPDLQLPDGREPREIAGLLFAWRRLAYLIDYRALLHREEGRPAAALDDAFLLLRFGQRIEGSQGDLTAYGHGLATKIVGLKLIVGLLEGGAPGEEELESISERLARYDAHRDGLRDALRADFAAFAALLRRAAHGKLAPGDPDAPLLSLAMLTAPALRPETTIEQAAAEIRWLIRETAVCARDRSAAGAGPRRAVRWRLDRYLANGAGKLKLEEARSRWLEWVGKADHLDWMVRSVRVYAALERYRREAGELPETLEALVPRHLEAVPLDPYDGKPLRYSRGRGIVYSVGSDFRDAGGAEGKDADEAWWDAAEPTLRVRR